MALSEAMLLVDVHFVLPHAQHALELLRTAQLVLPVTIRLEIHVPLAM
jgi:hypothetical protein